ncbi:heat shock protein beta 9-like [Brachionichthys hirsutus]|uniref:heat shock protein beta 9-like n=1 Tax=Brachionichthys hirsutus TaxID=412623 RepID=UPI0036051F98
MLCPSVFQPSPVAARPFLDLHWPIRSLWPETRPLFYHIEQEMIRHMQEMRHTMEYMERLHQKIFEELDQTCGSVGPPRVGAPLKAIGFEELVKDGSSFALSLDTQDFTPQELSVKQVGRKLRVSGKTERKKEDDEGSYAYTCREFRQDFDLPAGVRPGTVTCSLVDGRLQIQAPQERALNDGKERIVPINVASSPAIASTSGGAEESASSSSSSSESSPPEKK